MRCGKRIYSLVVVTEALQQSEELNLKGDLLLER